MTQEEATSLDPMQIILDTGASRSEQNEQQPAQFPVSSLRRAR
jgi:hypothetical protein